MACYLVISSRHLSNGHYRGIKGIFRGPLCKNGSASPLKDYSDDLSDGSDLSLEKDFAEKEKSAARALEDVKANFYCELCDKQYHKHHEFDNHINSYDHAHKQRLKELKQREFARNVASKSWKDEKKQEKALKRLHQLAELRKQAECVAGCRPLVKTPQVVVEEPQQRSQETFLLAQEGKAKIAAEGRSFTSNTSIKQQELLLNKDQPCMERHHLLRNNLSPAFSCGTNAYHRTGVSFSFSKKVHLKLESSASVFSENTEEAHDCTASSRQRVKQTNKGRAKVQKRLSTHQDHQDFSEFCSLAGKNKMQGGNDQNPRESEDTHLVFCKDKQDPPDMKSAKSPRIKAKELIKSQKSVESFITPQYQASNVCIEQKTYKHNSVLLAECVSEFSVQQSSEQGHSCELNFNPCVFKHSLASSKAVNADTEISKGDLVHEIKPKALPFLQVLSKDGSKALHWPTELLLFTKTEPSLSYGCNPLYFDFRLSLSHKVNGQHEASLETPKEHSKTMDIDRNEDSGLVEKQQLSCDKIKSLKPKKNRALNLKKSQPKVCRDKENKIDYSAPKYISSPLNENIPKVPAHLDCSQRHCLVATSPHTATCVRSLAQHFHNGATIQPDELHENICIYPLVSRSKTQICGNCDLMYSQRQTKQDLVTCPSDMSESEKDMILSCKLGCSGKCSEKERKVSFASELWSLSPLQKPYSDRQSNYSDTSVSIVTSNTTCCSNHGSGNHSRSNLSFCCKRKQKPGGKQKCKYKKHNCLPSSDNADVDCLVYKKTQRSRGCIQRHPIKYQRYLRYKRLLQGDISKQSRNRYPFCKYSMSRKSSSSKGSSIEDSGSTERSSTSTPLRGSSSGSFMKESMHIWNKRKRAMRISELEKSSSGHSDGQNVSCASKHSRIYSVRWLEKEVVRQKKSLTAKLLLEKVRSKRSQEQTQSTIDVPNSQPGTSSMESGTKLSSLEETLCVDANCLWNCETGKVESHTNEVLTIDNIMRSTNYSNCLIQDLILGGPGCQTLNMEAKTAIKEKSNVSTGETQPLLQSCDPLTGGFPGAFVSDRYSPAPDLTETKEEYNANMDLNRGEGNSNCYPDSAMHTPIETEHKAELHSKCFSSPLTQQPITFSPEEIDKYRLLQLQAQQHMQKQFVAKHLKVLAATEPAAFSAPPAVQPVPVQQYTSLATLQQTFLQSFALSTGVHPHSSHLSLTQIHPFSPSHITPIALSPFPPTFLPTHTALWSGHPLHLVSAAPVQPAHLAIPPLPHAAFIPTLFTPQLNAAASSTIHFNPLIQPVFQGQKLPRYS